MVLAASDPVAGCRWRPTGVRIGVVNMQNRPDWLPRFSPRTILRRVRVSDLVDFQAYRCDPEVARYQGWEIVSDGEARTFLVEVSAAALLQPGEWSQIAIGFRPTDRLIGDIGIFVDQQEREAEIGFTLNPRWQRQGLASEAVLEAIKFVFDCSPVHRIVAISDARNGPSLALLERIGMCKVTEQTSAFRGERCTEYVFATDRDDSGVTGPK